MLNAHVVCGAVPVGATTDTAPLVTPTVGRCVGSLNASRSCTPPSRRRPVPGSITASRFAGSGVTKHDTAWGASKSNTTASG